LDKLQGELQGTITVLRFLLICV